MSREGSPSGVERIILFSDAVFAIAITLLVLELRVPALPLASLGTAVAAALGLPGAYFVFLVTPLLAGLLAAAARRRGR